jgi:hypothetical protein
MSDPISLTTLIVYALATARLTALATGTDEITASPVLRLTSKINPAELDKGWRFLLSYGITCMWCASIYVGMLLMAPVAFWFPTEPWALVPALGLAFSQITGLLSGVGRD